MLRNLGKVFAIEVGSDGNDPMPQSLQTISHGPSGHRAPAKGKVGRKGGCYLENIQPLGLVSYKTVGLIVNLAHKPQFPELPYILFSSPSDRVALGTHSIGFFPMIDQLSRQPGKILVIARKSG